MSIYSASSTAAPDLPATQGAGLASPEFDRQEISGFGKDDGHAVTVIGKMLVGFFFYSLLVMAAVAWLTWSGVGQSQPESAASHHAVDANDF